ncbi:MAG TPA: gluconeogenesis factor YvcK family protein [Planctomycetota bacterium]|nr:gluconeogenesis factor YvcK family protein [Planctomycetota bacterium]
MLNSRKRRTRVVCIGGGTGQSQVLRGLSRYDLDITALVGVTDNGGHSGQLRKTFGIPQVGDIRNCLASLADEASVLGRLLRHRFREGELDGVSLGNLMVVALMRQEGSLSRAIETLGRTLGVPHTILPVSDQSTHICARLADGRMVRGEWEILRREPRVPIRELFIWPVVECHPDSVRAIAHADLIIFCPGSLVTGTIAALLTRGIQTAVRVSKALKVQIVNIMTHPGQTDGMSARDHIELLSQYLGTAPDAAIVNRRKPPEKWLRIYRKEQAEPVRLDVEGLRETRVIFADLLEPEGKDVLTLYQRGGAASMQVGQHFIRHDPAKLGRILWALAHERREGSVGPPPKPAG